MILFISFLVILSFSDVSGETKDKDCEGFKKFLACRKSSTAQWQNQSSAQPDLVALYFCQLMTSFVEECGTYLAECYAAEAVQDDLDLAVGAYLEIAEKFDGWDSESCPVVRDAIARDRLRVHPIVVTA